MKILVIGDFHIPDREKEIPFQILEEIQNSSYDLILCTGDLTKPEIFDQLESLAPVRNVIGNMDYYFGLRSFPRYDIIKLSKSKIGLTHGTRIRPRGNPEQLAHIAQEIDVDILISGHTHAQSIRIVNNILLLNPGSATGSWGGGPSTGIPSFQILQEIDESLRITSVRLKSGKITRQIKSYNTKTKLIQ